MNFQQKNLGEVKQILRETELEDSRKRELASALHVLFKDWLYGNSGWLDSLHFLHLCLKHKFIPNFVFSLCSVSEYSHNYIALLVSFGNNSFRKYQATLLPTRWIEVVFEDLKRRSKRGLLVAAFFRPSNLSCHRYYTHTPCQFFAHARWRQRMRCY